MNLKKNLSLEAEKFSVSGWMYRIFALHWTLPLWRKMEVITSVCLPETIDRNPSEEKKKISNLKLTQIYEEKALKPQYCMLFHREEAPIPATVI